LDTLDAFTHSTMTLLWPEQLPTSNGKRWKPNPMPRVPKTGWKPCDNFPSLANAKAIAVDVETWDPEIEDMGPGWGRGKGHIIGISLATDDGFNKYFPIRHTVGFNHDPAQTIRYVREQLSRAHQPKVGHNVLYDAGWLAHEGMPIVGQIHDTWTAEKLIDHSSSAALEEVAQRYLGEGKSSDALYDWAWQAWGRGTPKPQDKRKIAMKNLSKIPAELVGFYAESDTALPLGILPLQFAKLEELGLMEVYQLECDLIPLLVQMRLAGVSVDLDAAERAFDNFGDEIQKIQREVDVFAGFEVNTGSAQELAKVFDRLRIRYPRTEKTGAPSFKGEFLKTVEHPVAAKIMELEELKKFQSTFIKGQILDAHVNGKVYCTFNPLRAVTGRFSCSSPNLQQTPSRSELSKPVKACFIPDLGHAEWRDYDFSSIESRLLAHFAVGQGAKELRREYNQNPDTDYHTWTQSMIKRVVGLELNRKHVKNVNFAGIYGASEKKLQSMMGLTDEEATTFFEAYHSGLPFVRETTDHLSRLAEEHGHTRTILGRRAVFDHWEPKFSPRGAPRPVALPFDNAVRAYGPNIKRSHLHKAANYTIQGSAADLIKKGMVECFTSGIFDVIGVPRLTIHDALEFSVANVTPEVEQGFREMRHVLENAIKFRIPIRLDGHKGPNWGDVPTAIEI
jgi:DNA polymerase I-like protein with 3'-5' exonuclease and polymerase domains